MDGRFGARLRQRREEQGIDLIAIAAQTKIKMSLLEALERDDVSHWPSGIFRRAYIRAYAQAISLDPDTVLREFLEVHTEPEEIVTTEAIASAVDSRVHTGPPMRLRYIFGSAISSLNRLRRAANDDSVPAATIPEAVVPTVDRAYSPPAADRLVPSPTAPVEASAPLDLGQTDMSGPLEADLVDLPEPDCDALAVEEPEDLVTFSEPAGVAVEPNPLARIEASPGNPPLVDVAAPALAAVDFAALAQICTEFSQILDASALGPLLRRCAEVLDAAGLIVWVWDPESNGLRAALAHGYSDRVLAHLPVVGRDDDNATAAAFRQVQVCSTGGDRATSSALVVPVQPPGGCAGVLAVELGSGREQDPAVRAAATIVAAMLAQLVVAPREADAHEDEAPLAEPPRLHATAR